MTKEKPQPKIQSQELAMARRSLARAKAMDLTPKQKEKVMVMIKSARAEEKAGDKSKALNIYTNLKKYLEVLKLAKDIKEDEIRDDFDLKNKQVKLLDSEIEKVDRQIYIFGSDENTKTWRKALKKQEATIWQGREKKTAIFSDEDLDIYAKKILAEKDIWDIIKTIGDLPADHLFLQARIVDSNGNLLSMNLGVVGHPDTEYIYSLACSSKEMGVPLQTQIKKYTFDFVNNNYQDIKTIAEYDEDLSEWDIYPNGKGNPL